MMDARSLDFLLHAIKAPDPQYALEFGTPYGLHVAADNGIITLSLGDHAALHATERQSTSTRFRIEVFTGGSCVLSDLQSDGGIVKERNLSTEDLAAMFSTAWCSAVDEWAWKATAFSMSDGSPLGRPGVRWALEGAFLASWLALQRDVEQVEYALPHVLPRVVLEKSNVGTSLTDLVKTMNT